MTKLPWTVVAAVALASLLTGCAEPVEDPDTDTTLSPSFRPSVPSPTSTGLPAADEIAAWAAIALPEDRTGSVAPVLTASGPLDPGAGAVVDIEQAEGIWELLITCQTVDVSPISWRIASPAAPGDWTELDCSGPGGAGTPTTTIITFPGPCAQLNLTSTAEAVYAVQVRPHNEPLD